MLKLSMAQGIVQVQIWSHILQSWSSRKAKGQQLNLLYVIDRPDSTVTPCGEVNGVQFPTVFVFLFASPARAAAAANEEGYVVWLFVALNFHNSLKTRFCV
jgi:hypothetical protein